MNKIIEEKLKTLKDFQDKHPTSHVGGSFGLLIRGIDLKRDLSKSDLDITIDEFVFDPKEQVEYEQRSDTNDFDICIKKMHSSDVYTKIDIRVTPEPSFEVIEFNGEKYNVSKLRDILFWKKRYASKGVKKHAFDLIAMETGIRPLEPVNDSDDLPF